MRYINSRFTYLLTYLLFWVQVTPASPAHLDRLDSVVQPDNVDDQDGLVHLEGEVCKAPLE